MQQLTLDIGLSPEPALADFVVGANTQANTQLVQHLRLWAEGGLGTPVPSYIWGDSGCGKTHLLRAAGEALRQQGLQVGWLDHSVCLAPEFDERWSAILIDDVDQFTAEQQHAAFSWLVRAMYPAHGRPLAILAAGRWPPADLPLRDDLRSRLAWGHVFQLLAPGEAECRVILQRRAARRGLVLGDEVLSFMLNRFSRDLSSLVQLLDHLDHYSLQTQRPLTIPLLKSMLENV